MGDAGGIGEIIGIKDKKKSTDNSSKPATAFLKDIAGQVPGLPELTTDAEADLIKARALAERIRRAAFTGGGRKATIFTSPLGVVGPTPATKRTAAGI